MNTDLFTLLVQEILSGKHKPVAGPFFLAEERQTSLLLDVNLTGNFLSFIIIILDLLLFISHGECGEIHSDVLLPTVLAPTQNKLDQKRSLTGAGAFTPFQRPRTKYDNETH